MSLVSRKLRKSTIALSPAVAAQHDARRKRGHLIVSGISDGKLVTITPDQFDLLDVDRSYQRDRIDGSVTKLVAVMQNGGKILDPVTLCRRKFSQQGIDQRKLWIIDGQQRALACIEMQRPFQAMLHDSDSLEAEANFFIAMDDRVKINSSLMVHSWPGHTGKVIRSAAMDQDHPLYGRVDFKGIKGGYRASVLAAAVAGAVGASLRGGSVKDTLAKSDYEVARDSHNIARSKSVLTLIPLIFSGSMDSAHTPAVAVKALAAVAHKKWASLGNAPHPCKKCINNISRMNWTLWAPSNNDRVRLTLEIEIDKRWKC